MLTIAPQPYLVNDPCQHEAMSLCEFHYFSDVLGMNRTANVILPNRGVAGSYRVMFLLHGLSDDHTIWLRRTSVERYVDGLPLIVVMPDGGRGFYTNAVEGPEWAIAMGEELPEIISHAFPTGEDWCITGLSMGGYGALRLAFGYPDRFKSANSHSGALLFGHNEEAYKNQTIPPEFRRILGDHPKGGPSDLVHLATTCHKEKLPKLRIDCGSADFLIEDNRSYIAKLTELGIPHLYEEFAGEHNWAYWDVHVQEAIAFHRTNLGF